MASARADGSDLIPVVVGSVAVGPVAVVGPITVVGSVDGGAIGGGQSGLTAIVDGPVLGVPIVTVVGPIVGAPVVAVVGPIVVGPMIA